MANKRLRMNISFSDKEAELFEYIMSKDNSSKFLKLLAKKYWEEELEIDKLPQKEEKNEQSTIENNENSSLLSQIIQRLDDINLEILNLKDAGLEQKHEQYDSKNDEMLKKFEL